MKYKAIKYLAIFLVAAFQTVTLSAQQPQTPEEKARELRKNIDTMLDRMADNFQLEEWQLFYMDSILTHDYGAMAAEMEKMQASKVENTDLYQAVQDRWMNRIYESTKKVLNEQQWQKYLKYGAARDKKARDKREAGRMAPVK